MSLAVEGNIFDFDVLEIDRDIRNSKRFERKKDKENIFIFKQYYGEDNMKYSLTSTEDLSPETYQKIAKKYLSEIKVKTNEYDRKFVGVLSSELLKNGFCFVKYNNYNYYLGEFSENLRDGVGIYYYKKNDERNEKGEIIKEIYVGEWKKGKKEGKGLLLKVNKGCFSRVNEIECEILRGDFTDNLVKDGEKVEIFTKKNQHFSYYKGKLNDDGEREDDDCVYVEDDNKAFNGSFIKNVMSSGIFVLQEEGSVKSYYIENIGNKDDFEFKENEEKEKEKKIIEALESAKGKFIVLEELLGKLGKNFEADEKFLEDFNMEKYEKINFEEVKKVIEGMLLSGCEK